MRRDKQKVGSRVYVHKARWQEAREWLATNGYTLVTTERYAFDTDGEMYFVFRFMVDSEAIAFKLKFGSEIDLAKLT